MFCLYILMLPKNCLNGNPLVTFSNKTHAYKLIYAVLPRLIVSSQWTMALCFYCLAPSFPPMQSGNKEGMQQREELKGMPQSYNSHRGIVTKKNNLWFLYYSETWEAAILSGTQVNAKAETEKDKCRWWKLLLSFTQNFNLLEQPNILCWVE